MAPGPVFSLSGMTPDPVFSLSGMTPCPVFIPSGMIPGPVYSPSSMTQFQVSARGGSAKSTGKPIVNGFLLTGLGYQGLTHISEHLPDLFLILL